VGGNETWGSNEDVEFRDQMNDCQLLEEFFRSEAIRSAVELSVNCAHSIAARETRGDVGVGVWRSVLWWMTTDVSE
jgi:hypothetical protein